MKEIKISDEFYKYINKNRLSDKETVEDILKRILGVHNLEPIKDKKVVFVGKAGVGKSTVRKVFFEFNNPEQLLEHGLEPTFGLDFHIYNLFEYNMGVVDTSGQELDSLLEEKENNMFQGADFALFLVDASLFLENYKQIYELLKQICLVARMNSPEIIIGMFIHKIDLLNKMELKKLKNFVLNEHISFQIAEGIDIPYFYTSIKDDYIKSLNFAFIKFFYLDSIILPNYERFLTRI